MTAEHITPDGIMQLGMGFWGSKTLLTAIELGVFTELAKEPMDANHLHEGLASIREAWVTS